MNNDDKMICNRFIEAADNCYYRNMPVTTDFLDLYKQSLFNSIIKDLPPVHHMVMGGYDLAERKLVQFLPDADYAAGQPFTVLKITPANSKFAEELTHRDYLGAILNLGISRDKIGDILICKDEVYLFCTNGIADFLIDNITKIRHTFVITTRVEQKDFNYEPEFEEITGTVASIRLDAVIAIGFHFSRNHIITYIEDGKVAVNGRIITSNAYNICPGDIISVRGLGKIRFKESVSETRKGRLMIKIYKYI